MHVFRLSLLEPGPRDPSSILVAARAGVPWSVDPASSAFVADTPFLNGPLGAGAAFPTEDEADVLGRRRRIGRSL